MSLPSTDEVSIPVLTDCPSGKLRSTMTQRSSESLLILVIIGDTLVQGTKGGESNGPVIAMKLLHVDEGVYVFSVGDG